MSRLVALVSPLTCAGALNRAWPDDTDSQVRCLDEGTRAMGLDLCCAPWSPRAEDVAVRAELAGGVSPAAISGLSKTMPETGAETVFAGLDAVTAGLVRTPGAAPVVGLVSGPGALKARNGEDTVEALDAASDLAAARIQALAGCGVDRVMVLETGVGDPEPVAEAHRPLLRASAHLRLEVLVVITGMGDPASLGYRHWVSARGCADGLGFLPATAFESASALTAHLDQGLVGLGSADEVVTAPLGAVIDPGLIRKAAGLVAAAGTGGSR